MQQIDYIYPWGGIIYHLTSLACDGIALFEIFDEDLSRMS